MSMHWIVIADAARARFVEADEMFDQPRVVRVMHHPESRIRTSDLVSGERGAAQAGPGGERTSYERHTDPHRVEAAKFAAEIAAELRTAWDERRYERLVLCAPAHFLGALRAAIDPQLADVVVGTVSRDWTSIADVRVPEMLRHALKEDAGFPPER